MRRRKLRLTALAFAGWGASPALAFAQNVPGPGHSAIALSGFETVAAAPAGAEQGTGLLSESEVEASALTKTRGGILLGARGVINVIAAAGNRGNLWRAALPEWSAFVVGPFGRIEVGERAGFPQSLVGFTPSEIAFATAPFGPTGGTRLDPDGRLPTRALPVPLAARINNLSPLGYAARFYGDRSAKIVWITPRTRRGFYGAFSYTPRITRSPGVLLGEGSSSSSSLPGARAVIARQNLIQAAAVWNHRSAAVDLTVGATVSHVRERGADLRWRGTASVNGGVTATLRDTWTLGVTATVDDPPGGRGTAHPYGVVTSLDWISGPWVVGGYLQHAESPLHGGNPGLAKPGLARPGLDRLDIAEAGVSLQIDRNHDLFGAGRYTDARVFAAAYHYLLAGTPSNSASGQARDRGLVLLAGAQFSFF